MVLFTACGHDKRKADLTGIDFDVRLERFDRDFWTMHADSTDNVATIAKIKDKYGAWAELYVTQVLQLGPTIDDSLTLATLPLFFGDSGVHRLYTDVLEAYSNVNDIEKQLTGAFRRAKYFFPQLPTPRCYMHVSGFNQNVVVGTGFVSVSADDYMGADYPLYKGHIYTYLLPNMCRRMMAPDMVKAWLISEFPFVPQTGELLEELIYDGKIVYLQSVLMPALPDSILMGYSKTQLAWSRKNENAMWTEIVESRHLFTQESIWRSKYLHDAPFTQPFTQSSPGRGGVYLGWRIVESYMAKHEAITPLQLMQQHNCRYILEESGYNPK